MLRFVGLRRAGIAVILAALLVAGYLHYGRTSPTGEPLNISCFVYRDLNRNGIYDLGDRPYAGLAMTLEGPNGVRVNVRSNIAGFANFRMARPGIEADITAPGRYAITATPPPGWTITSSNAAQSTNFRKLDTSPAGLVAESTFVPMGVAPELSISGSVARDASGTAPPAGTLSATLPSGNRITVAISPEGRFAFRAFAGRWLLVYTLPDGRSQEREVHVSDHPVIVSALAPGRPVPPPGTATRTVDFDALTTSDTLHEIPNGYAGLNWVNWVATHHKLYGGHGYVNATVSSEYLAYNSSGHPAAFSSDQGFDLAGVHVGVAWPAAEGHDIVVRAWRRDRLVHEDRLRGRVAGPSYFDADYRDITRVEFSSEAYWQILIDDLVIRRR